MKKMLFFSLFVAFLAQKARAQDDDGAEKFKPQAWLGASVGYQNGAYRFGKTAMYGQAPFDRHSGLEVGLAFRPQIAENAHLAFGAHFFSRKMRSDGQFEVLVPGIGVDVLFSVDGRQSFVGGNLGFGFSHRLASGARPYAEIGAVFDFPLQKTVDQEQNFFGQYRQNPLLAGKEAFGGYGELGVFWPLGERVRLLVAGRFSATQTSVKTFEEIQIRTISQNMFVRRWLFRLGAERLF